MKNVENKELINEYAQRLMFKENDDLMRFVDVLDEFASELLSSAPSESQSVVDNEYAKNFLEDEIKYLEA